jgi:hypothetical protein
MGRMAVLTSRKESVQVELKERPKTSALMCRERIGAWIDVYDSLELVLIGLKKGAHLVGDPHALRSVPADSRNDSDPLFPCLTTTIASANDRDRVT